MESRQHYLDAARAFLMCLGIPYHASIVYSASVPWLIHDGHTSRILALFGTVSNSFRMPAFFIIAGYFTCMSFAASRLPSWLVLRLLRLGVPLIAGSILFGPFQTFCSELSRRTVTDLTSLQQVLQATYGRLGQISGAWIHHLWFLGDLIVMTLLFCALWEAVRRLSSSVALNRLLRRVRSAPIGSTGWILIAIAGLTIYRLLLDGIDGTPADASWQMLNIAKTKRILANLPYFLIGATAARDRRILGCLDEPSAALCAGSLAAALCYARVIGAHPALFAPLKYGLVATSSLGLSYTVFAVARRFFARPSILARSLADRAFAIYILHQPVIIVLALLAMPVPLAPVLKFCLVSGATLGLCYSVAGWSLRVPSLAFLLDGRIPARLRVTLGRVRARLLRVPVG